MNLDAIIVDDDENHYLRLKNILSILNIKVLGTYIGKHPYDGASEQVRFNKPKLVIIDHELNEPDKSGLTFYKEIANPYIFAIFISQHPEKARENDTRFINAKYITKDSRDQHLIEKFKEALEAATSYFTNFLNVHLLHLESNDQSYAINCTNIIYLEGARKNTLLFIEDFTKPLKVSKGLTTFFEIHNLHSLGFVQIQKSYIINRYHIQSVRPGNKMIFNGINSKKKEIRIGEKYKDDPLVQQLIELYKK